MFGVEFEVRGKAALFSEPVTGRDKTTYKVPTYGSLKGLCDNIYWKPSITWVIDAVRVMNSFDIGSTSVKTVKRSGGRDLMIYTFLRDVRYQIRAHIEWNNHCGYVEEDKNIGKHLPMFLKALEVGGGRMQPYLGVKACGCGFVDLQQCKFGEGNGAFDYTGDIDLGFMFHSFGYPASTPGGKMVARFWMPKMTDGVINFCRGEECPVVIPINARSKKSQ